MFSQIYCLKRNNPHACPQVSVSLLKIKHLAQGAGTHLGTSTTHWLCIAWVTFCMD